MHKISDKFKFWPDRTTDYGVSCPWGLKISYRLIMGKWCLHASSFIFDRIVIKVAGNQDRHKSSNKLDFGPLVSMAHLYVFWSEIWPWHIGLRWVIVALWATCFLIWQNCTEVGFRPWKYNNFCSCFVSRTHVLSQECSLRILEFASPWDIY